MNSTPTHRKLRGYAFDPSLAATIDKRQSNEVIYKVPWENPGAGPSGEYVEIIDYDPTRGCFYEAINLNDKEVLADHGLPPSEGNPSFHQQQVYAVVMSVIEQFERALGRKVIWSRIIEETGEHREEFTHEFIAQLRIYPHALRQQNAFYSPQKVALLFGYFQASPQWFGNNVPGCGVFTCLSPDIVAHEVTHAILDSMHPYLRKDTNDDMLAFHEGFADIIALLQRFTFQNVVEEQIRNSRGDLLSPQNLLGDLAIQFGQAVSGNRRALRSFLIKSVSENKKVELVEPDPRKYCSVMEPHSRGGLLVAAVFNAFTRLYRYRVADLRRLASNGTGILEPGDIDSDLVRRLSFEACEIASKLMMICIRALDYCPPTDLSFGDYLRALITADVEANPEDEDGLRYALLEAFRSWGIVPSGVKTYSVESLMWKPLEEYYEDNPNIEALKEAVKDIFNLAGDSSSDPQFTRQTQVITSMEKILREDNRKKIFEESKKLCRHVHNKFSATFEDGMNKVVNLLGMCFDRITYSWDDLDGQTSTDDASEDENKKIILTAEPRDKFQVYRCRPIIRHNSRTGSSSKVLLITFLQKVYVNLQNSPYEGYFPEDKYDFRGGSTLIIDLASFNIKYAIVKNIASSERLRQQLDYALRHISDNANAALLMQDEEPFAALHAHS